MDNLQEGFQEVKVKGKSFKIAYAVYLMVIILIVGSGFAGFAIGTSRERALATDPTALSAAGEPNYRALREAWGVINREFYGDLKAVTQADGAVYGMVASLGDQFTTYLPPKVDTAFREDLKGQFGGIGAELETRNNLITVVAPLPNTPAERAGLLASDIITKVNDTSTQGKALDAVVDLIRGDAGTSLNLTIVREGVDKPITINLVREIIVVKTVETAALANGAVSYIRVTKFGDDTTTLFREALNSAKASGAKALIIDLRNNPGGYLESASSMIGMLIPDKVVSDNEFLKKRTSVREKSCDYTGSGDDRKCTEKDLTDTTSEPAILPDIPIRILVNGGSASASEIFSGAMRDYDRAKLVGTLTFGKGSVQDLVSLKEGGSVKVTIAHWLTPLGSEINKVGVKPDTDLALPAGVKPAKDDVQATEALKQLGF